MPKSTFNETSDVSLCKAVPLHDVSRDAGLGTSAESLFAPQDLSDYGIAHPSPGSKTLNPTDG